MSSKQKNSKSKSSSYGRIRSKGKDESKAKAYADTIAALATKAEVDPDFPECLFHKKSLPSKYAKAKLRGMKDDKEYYVHHIVMGSKGITEWGDNDQISHLCHNTRCINKEHLIVETKAANLARNLCKGWSHMKHRDEWINVCAIKGQCNPPCILRKPQTMRDELHDEDDSK